MNLKLKLTLKKQFIIKMSAAAQSVKNEITISLELRLQIRAIEESCDNDDYFYKFVPIDCLFDIAAYYMNSEWMRYALKTDPGFDFLSSYEATTVDVFINN